MDRNFLWTTLGGRVRKKQKRKHSTPTLFYAPTVHSVCALHLAVIVAVTIMGVMQMAIDQVVYMIAFEIGFFHVD
jgi:hypothetical protein